MTDILSRDWTLAKRPTGTPTADEFALQTNVVAGPAEGEIQVRNTWMSVDPYMRGRMYDRENYIPPFQIGEPMEGGAMGRVTSSGHPDFAIGDLVTSNLGWREAWTATPKAAKSRKVRDIPGISERAYLGVLGMPGIAAYVGILRIGALKKGDVVFVSGAAGAVGSTVVQIAKIKGCTVIGSAGGPEKVSHVIRLGADECIDYRAANNYEELLAALRSAAPKGIDVYFDNVGGDHFQAAIETSVRFGRIVLCGMISQYSDGEVTPGPHNIIQAIRKELTIRGYVVSSHYDLISDFFGDMVPWITSGQLKYEETVLEGIENAPTAFLGLFNGQNKGKMLVSLNGDSSFRAKT